MTPHPRPLTFASVHICFDEDKTLSDALAQSLATNPVRLDSAFREWIDFALKTEEASVIPLPFLGLAHDNLCVMRRAGRLFIVYAHPNQDRSHVAQVLCHLNRIIHHAPHALILKNSTCQDRIRSVFDQTLPLAEAA